MSRRLTDKQLDALRMVRDAGPAGFVPDPPGQPVLVNGNRINALWRKGLVEARGRRQGRSVYVLTADGRAALGNATKSPQPTGVQIAALAAYAAEAGPEWKEELALDWMRGGTAIASLQERWHLLQQVRNQLGPQWLGTFDLQAAIARHNATYGPAATVTVHRVYVQEVQVELPYLCPICGADLTEPFALEEMQLEGAAQRCSAVSASGGTHGSIKDDWALSEPGGETTAQSYRCHACGEEVAGDERIQPLDQAKGGAQ